CASLYYLEISRASPLVAAKARECAPPFDPKRKGGLAGPATVMRWHGQDIACERGKMLTEVSQKAVRVDVDVELDVTFGFCRARAPRAQIGGEIKSARRFDQKAKSVASAHDGKRCFRRTEHARIAAMRGGGGEPSGKAFCGRAVAGRDQKAREAAKGRVSGLLASVDL